MNVVRGDQFYGKRRQNDGVNAGPVSYRPTMMAPRSANFRVRNQGISDTWRNGASRTFNRTPVRPITASTSSSSIPRGRSATTSSSGHRNSAVRTCGTSSSSSRSHATPGDLRTPRSSTSNETETNCIVAIAEGRGQARGEVGLAAIDIRRPHLILCQLSDSQTYSNALAKINVFNPIEVLLPNTFCEATQTNKLFSCVRDQYPNITITTVQRRHFNDSRGLQLIQMLCAPEFSSVEVLVAHRFYALAAAAALLKYVEFIQNMIFAPKSLRVDYQGSQNTMLIDIDTAQRLELVRGARGSACSATYSLLGTLSHCSTAGGLRLLRASLLQPPCLAKDIEERLDCVQELVNSPALFHALQGVLPRLAEVEQLLALSMAAPTTGQAAARHSETQLNYALLLKSCLENVTPLSEALVEAEAPYFCAVREKLQHEAFESILEHVRTVLHEDARTTKGFSAAHLQRCFAVRTGINGLLDVARKTYCELVDDVTEMVNRYKEEFGLPLRVGFSSTRGFHVQMPLSGTHSRLRTADLPPLFIQVHKSRSVVTMTTQELVHTDQRCKEALQEIQTMSTVVISELLAETRQHAGCLYQLCEAVAQVDLLMALANVSALPGYVRPSFGPVLCVRASRHPILAFLHHTEPVANDVYASLDNNFHILTGPNMGGKSIYIRQVALLQVLAQVGCFVPAETATFRVADRIFSRIGFDDSIESNASTFVLEMREMQFVLQNVTARSLVIVDELCRGTSSEEGTSLAWALCERLLSTPAFTFFTTHFLFLTRLQDVYPCVTNHHMEAIERTASSSTGPGVMEEEEGTPAVSSRSGSIRRDGGSERGDDGSIRRDSGSERRKGAEDEEAWIRYTHRLLPGVTKLERYGLRLAKLSLMPTSVTNRAEVLLQQLSAARKPDPAVGGSSSKERAYFTVCAEVLTATEECGTDSEAMRQRCKEIQARFIAQFPDWQQDLLEPAPSPHTPSQHNRSVSSSSVVQQARLSLNLHSPQVNDRLESEQPSHSPAKQAKLGVLAISPHSLPKQIEQVLVPAALSSPLRSVVLEPKSSVPDPLQYETVLKMKSSPVSPHSPVYSPRNQTIYLQNSNPISPSFKKEDTDSPSFKSASTLIIQRPLKYSPNLSDKQEAAVTCPIPVPAPVFTTCTAFSSLAGYKLTPRLGAVTPLHSNPSYLNKHTPNTPHGPPPTLAATPRRHIVGMQDVTPSPSEEAAVPDSGGSPALPAKSPVYTRIRPRKMPVRVLVPFKPESSVEGATEDEETRREDGEVEMSQSTKSKTESRESMTSSAFLNFASRD